MTTTPSEAGSDATPSRSPAASGIVLPAGGGAPAGAHGGTPRDRRSCLGTVLALAVAAVSVVYLVNPGLGVLEILPDNLPLVGNLDEAFFTAALLSALGYLGLRLPFAAGARK